MTNIMAHNTRCLLPDLFLNVALNESIIWRGDIISEKLKNITKYLLGKNSKYPLILILLT